MFRNHCKLEFLEAFQLSRYKWYTFQQRWYVKKTDDEKESPTVIG